MTDLSIFVLAGGKSTRMGADKAFLEWQSSTLLDHAVLLARLLASDTCVIGDPQKFSGHGAPVISDIYPDRGPLGGIHAALRNSTTELNLMLAVDMPLLTLPLLSYLVDRARQSDAIVTVPRSGGRFQPLCGIYRSEFADVAERSLQAGKNKIDPLFAQVKTLVIEEAELSQAGFSADLFRNVNTPADLEALRAIREV